MTPPAILLIEDEPVLLGFLERLFAAHGYRVVSATTGRSGLALADAEAPACIFCDYHFPDMTGLAVLKAPRTNGHAQLPVTLISADVGLADATCIDATQLGAQLLLGVTASPAFLAAAEAMLTARPNG